MYKVVVIEDEQLVRQGIILGTDWSSIDCMVVGEASNGMEGCEVIQQCKPDLIITDIRMPKMDGIEMVRKLEEMNLRPFAVFLTAYDDFSYAQQAVRLHAADYLLKPFQDGQLEETVKRILAQLDAKQEPDRISGNLPELQLDKGDKSKYISDAMAYMEANYANPELSIKAVASHLGLSEGHLSHLFRKETKFTPMTYVTRCRMRAAMQLLKDYKYKVYEVAELVGYHDITYFSVSFKKYVGVAPREYQDRYRDVQHVHNDNKK